MRIWSDRDDALRAGLQKIREGVDGWMDPGTADALEHVEHSLDALRDAMARTHYEYVIEFLAESFFIADCKLPDYMTRDVSPTYGSSADGEKLRYRTLAREALRALKPAGWPEQPA